MAEGRFTRTANGPWQYEAQKQALLDPTYLKDPQLAARAEQIISQVLKRK